MRNCRQVPSPPAWIKVNQRYYSYIIFILPIHQDIPLFSIIVPKAQSSMAPFPATNESPMAAITSISPGLSLCTLVGFTIDLPTPNLVLFAQGKGISLGKGCWSLLLCMLDLFG